MGWLAPMLKDRKARTKVLGCMLSDSLRHAATSGHDALMGESGSADAATAALADDEKDALRDLAGSETANGAAFYDTAEQSASSTSSDSAASTIATVRKVAQSSSHFRGLSLTKQANVLKWVVRDRSNRIRLLEAQRKSLDVVLRVGAIPHTKPGPGRVDAFMTALNLLQEKSTMPMTSPVAYPPLWGTSTLRWLHYDGDTDASLQRNMGQSLGVGGVFVVNKKDPKKIDATTVNARNLKKLEDELKAMTPPRWPFSPVEPKLVASGRQIYVRERCGRCHDPDETGAMPELPHAPLPPDDDPKTDRERLDNFDRNIGNMTAIKFLAQQLDALAATAPNDLRDKNPVWRLTGRYAPRSLAGVWATAPYLHNNSVPTLWDLLSSKRPATFAVDYAHYDTAKVGFATTTSGEFVFVTSEEGNSNEGHSWGTGLLKEEKQALIEYLKQL